MYFHIHMFRLARGSSHSRVRVIHTHTHARDCRDTSAYVYTPARASFLRAQPFRDRDREILIRRGEFRRSLVVIVARHCPRKRSFHPFLRLSLSRAAACFRPELEATRAPLYILHSRHVFAGTLAITSSLSLYFSFFYETFFPTAFWIFASLARALIAVRWREAARGGSFEVLYLLIVPFRRAFSRRRFFFFLVF